MTAYYNEIDPYAAQWLRNLISAGHISPGVVDERSIEDVRPRDLDGFTQCHFFAGIGVWSYSLRLARWPDDRPVWSGSCPCQPFSAAGKGAGFADERHLWPAWHHLIRECKPAVVFGEQVASKDVDPWIDLVQDDLEAMDYAFGAIPFPSAGVGAPHIRDRMYWMAHHHQGLEGRTRAASGAAECVARARGVAGVVADTERAEFRDEGLGALGAAAAGVQGQDGQRQRLRLDAGAGSAAVAGLVADDDDAGQQRLAGLRLRGSDVHDADGRSPLGGFWADAEWIACRDGKWRPVEAGPQPLVDGSAESLGRVRPEVLAQVEEEVNAAAAQTEGGRTAAMRALLQGLGAQAKRCWPAGRLPGLHEAPFLLAFVRQLEAQGWVVAQGVALPRAEATSGLLRGVWHTEALAGPSHRRELEEQRTDEPADVVRVLSRLLARHASQAWDDAYAAYAEVGFPLGHNSRSRVGRLRAYGNAINAQQAKVFIEAVMEAA